LTSLWKIRQKVKRERTQNSKIRNEKREITINAKEI
jgi:hypothetical protein